MSARTGVGDRIAGAFLPWVLAYSAYIALSIATLEPNAAEVGGTVIAVLVAFVMIRPRADLVGGRAGIAGAAVFAIPPIAALSGPMFPIVPPSLVDAWWVPITIFIVGVAAIAGETLARSLARAGRITRDAVLVAACLAIAGALLRITWSAGSAPSADEVLATMPLATIDIRTPLETVDRERGWTSPSDGTTVYAACGRECTTCECTIWARRGDRTPTAGSRPLRGREIVIAELPGAIVIAPRDEQGRPAWRLGIAFARATLDPVAITADDLGIALGYAPRLARSALAGCTVALVALFGALALRRRSRRIGAMRELEADEHGVISIDGTMVPTSPVAPPGPALVAADRRAPTTYRDAPSPVRAISGSRAALVSALEARVLALEILAIAAVLTGIAPIVAPGYVIPSPF